MCEIGHIVIEMKHEGNPVKICSFQAGSFEIDFKREEIHVFHCQCSSKCKENIECCNKCDRQPNQTCRGNIMSHQCKDAISSIRIVSKECYKIENGNDNREDSNRMLSCGARNKDPCSRNPSPCARIKGSNTADQVTCNTTTRCQNPKDKMPCTRTTEKNAIEQQACQTKFRDNCWPNRETKNAPCATKIQTCVKDKQRSQSPCNTKYKDYNVEDKRQSKGPCGPETIEHSTVQCQLKKAYLQNNPPQTQCENKTSKQTDETPSCKTKCRSIPAELKTLDKCNLEIQMEPQQADIVNWQRKQSNPGHITFQSNHSDINLNNSGEQSELITESMHYNILKSYKETVLGSYHRESMTEPSFMDLPSTQISSLRKTANKEVISCQSVKVDTTHIYKDTLINENGESFIRCQVTVPDCQSENIINKLDNSKLIENQIVERNNKEYEECLGSDDEYNDCE